MMQEERKELLYTDLSAIAIGGKDEKLTTDKWLCAPYETAEFSGVALIACETCHPTAVRLRLNANGWYKIYLCLAEVSAENALEISLSGTEGKTMVTPVHLDSTDGTYAWSRFDFAEEVFYTAADLTGQKLILHKPCYGKDFTAALFAVRLVPMTKEEISAAKQPKNTGRIAYHFDTDYLTECDYDSVEDYLGRVNLLRDGNGEILIHECYGLHDQYELTNPSRFRKATAQKAQEGKKILPQILDALKDRAHAYGMKILSGIRPEAGKFVYPFAKYIGQDGAYAGKEYRLCTREGRTLAAGSYAFKEVRSAVIAEITEHLPADWDGVSIYLTRGILVGFEKPILDAVYEKYGVDARRLPYGDARLTEALCAAMRSFFTELRERLDELAKERKRERYHVNVVTLYGYENCKEFGYDVAEWAKSGLIDGICQGLMGYAEDVTDLLAEDGLIDMEKYAEAQKTRHVFTRCFDDNTARIVKEVPAWLEISKEYGVPFYATMPWEWPAYDRHIATAQALYAAGAEKIICWNANHSLKRLDTMQALKDCGDKEKITGKNDTVYRKLFRVYSLCGNDISSFCVNWKG